MNQVLQRLSNFRISNQAVRLFVFGIAAFVLVTSGLFVSAAPGQDTEEARTVWDGVFTDEQATRGGERFLASCARCHGSELEGGANRASPLVGETFQEGFRERTVDELFDYIRTNMPNGDAGTLSIDTYVDVTAFILSRNGYPAGDAELTAESTVDVQIIAEDGPGELPNSSLARVVGCLAPGEGFGNWTLNNSTAPERIDAAGLGENDATVALGERSFDLKFVLVAVDAFVGQRMSVSGLLMGEGGVDGINVTLIESVAEACE